MSEKSMSRSTYLNKNVGDYAETVEVFGQQYEKVSDLRYGTNPHQTAACYKPVGHASPIGELEVLKDGKSGLSQTNLEDISYALNIVKYFDRPAVACMKHVNPSGAAVQKDDEKLETVYKKSRDADPRAAFGSTIGFNCEVDVDTAKEIMSSFVECVVAPSYAEGVLDVFNDKETFKLNRHVRVLKCGDLSSMPKYVGDDARLARSIKVLHDGSLVIADPLLTGLRSVNDLQRASGTNKACGEQISTIEVSDQQREDLLAGWYINMNVRSNGVVIMKDGVTLAVGTGEQDRVGAVEQAIVKFKEKFEGDMDMSDSVMSSDGFFPFSDAVEVAAAAGVKACIAPAGSLKDADVIKKANELGVALFHAPERIFSHH
ncbi:MAG: IMP cyclohydrolase [Lentisphaeria bacterium]|nr:IMP cyclohydrolase [Lentisphaeria bacterium]